MSYRNITVAVLLVLAALGGFIYSNLPYSNPPETVSKVDLYRYVGFWYEISSIPAFFAIGCSCSTANYTDLGDGTIKVWNSCLKDGKREGKEAKAWPVDETNSKLKVQFFWPFTGDYWIVALDREYRWVVVSDPRKEYMWILSRTQEMQESVYDNLINYLKSRDLPVDKLVRTNENC